MSNEKKEPIDYAAKFQSALNAEDGLELRLLGRLHLVISEFEMLGRVADLAMAHEASVPASESAARASGILGDQIEDQDALRALSEAVTAISEAAKAPPPGGPFLLPADLPLEEALIRQDLHLKSGLYTRLGPVFDVGTKLPRLGSRGATTAATYLMTDAVFPMAPVIREGLYALAVSVLERHIVRLWNIYDEWVSHEEEKRARTTIPPGVKKLLSWLNSHLDTFDVGGEETKQVRVIAARRNARIHRENRVDAPFVREVPESNQQLGMFFDTDDASLRETLSALSAYCARSVIVAGYEWVSDCKRAGPNFVMTAQALYARGDWIGLAWFSRGLIDKVPLDDEDRERERLNYFLAVKRIHGVKAIQTEVRNWKPLSGPLWELAKYALLDDLDRAIQIVENSPEVRSHLVASAKVFDELRQDPRIVELLGG
jgi:hypothetical protein